MPTTKQTKRPMSPPTVSEPTPALRSPPDTPEQPAEKRIRIEPETYRTSLEGMRDQQRSCKLFNALVGDPAAVIETVKFGKNINNIAVKNVQDVKHADMITFVGPIWEHDMRTDMAEVRSPRFAPC